MTHPMDIVLIDFLLTLLQILLGVVLVISITVTIVSAYSAFSKVKRDMGVSPINFFSIDLVNGVLWTIATMCLGSVTVLFYLEVIS